MDKNIDFEKNVIFVALFKTQTTVGNLIRFFTNKPYNHVSLSFDYKLNDLWSFSPITNGLTEEKLVSTFDPDDKIAIYFIKATEDQINDLKEFLEKIKEKHFSYSFISAIRSFFNIKSNADETLGMFCSWFVSDILKKSNITVVK
jgi:hypothetical protein